MITDIRAAGVNNVRNVSHYIFGENSLDNLPSLLADRRKGLGDSIIFLVDEFFKDKNKILDRLHITNKDQLIIVDTGKEPTTTYINEIYSGLVNIDDPSRLVGVVGIGGGITLDTAKAVSNLLGNGGMAEDYQGWDLLTSPGLYKIGIPTISGTGSEATRTCVMTNAKNGLKLGMNSEYTIYDQLVLDPELTKTVPRSQYFYTGMDAYIHCTESLSGSYRNTIGDALSSQSLNLCRQVFLGNDMLSDRNRANLMVASYLGGCAIASSYVGVVHPFSAGLSVVLGLHHGVANCIALAALGEFYGTAKEELLTMAQAQDIDIPHGVCANLSEDQYDQLYKSTVVHEKPLTNALGPEYRNLLTRDKVYKIFSTM
ncbi:MAG TPA: iron-containing alcohol dehydrogenase [Dehalococcoidia bacterium]|nr:iron-containing alcohol dehydrogenase [Dehalococcoidia bacterium]